VVSQLRGEDDLQVETVAGGLGEFIVFLGGREDVATNRL
jgi:hypothetical protein